MPLAVWLQHSPSASSLAPTSLYVLHAWAFQLPYFYLCSCSYYPVKGLLSSPLYASGRVDCMPCIYSQIILHILYILYSSVVKKSACDAGEPGSIHGSERSTGEGIGYPLQYSWATLVAQLVKNLPAMWETWIPSLGWEDPLEKGTATHSSILAWRIPWTV